MLKQILQCGVVMEFKLSLYLHNLMASENIGQSYIKNIRALTSHIFLILLLDFRNQNWCCI